MSNYSDAFPQEVHVNADDTILAVKYQDNHETYLFLQGEEGIIAEQNGLVQWNESTPPASLETILNAKTGAGVQELIDERKLTGAIEIVQKHK